MCSAAMCLQAPQPQVPLKQAMGASCVMSCSTGEGGAGRTWGEPSPRDCPRDSSLHSLPGTPCPPRATPHSVAGDGFDECRCVSISCMGASRVHIVCFGCGKWLASPQVAVGRRGCKTLALSATTPCLQPPCHAPCQALIATINASPPCAQQ